ncbi:Efflux ABC transporter, ATP-binding protein [hydrothermal vent metagenome]|uniref:Efflux ABC transporter, ATP-binding protein n=1 Tax=hydrothermal vent metagenome TaxID=652676 RepID=A0A3B0U4B9_9ZZZZ
MPEIQTMINARGLKRSFKTAKGVIEAVKNISFEVNRGEIVGFLGPNGAGKSTVLKMLCTLLSPSDGEVSIAGFDLLRDAKQVRRHIGYVSQSGSTSHEAKAGDEIVWHAQLYGIDRFEAKERGKLLFEALDLEGQWEQKCGSLSGGQRRRLDIAMGLIHQPELIFLDEPSTGLDPQSRANLWDNIRKLREDFDTTIFLTTHYMDEADALCDRLLIIDHGEIVGRGEAKALKSQVAGDNIKLTLRDNKDTQKAAVCSEHIAIAQPVISGNVVQVMVKDGASSLPKLAAALNEGGIEAIGIEVSQPTLDDVFLSLTGRSLRD